MEKNAPKIMPLTSVNNDEDEWESIPENEQTEETKDILYRLNIEGASKLKFDLNKKKNYHSLKVKKLIQKEKDSFYELDKYIKEEYIPNISIKQNYNSNPYATILNNDFILKQHPEIGTCLIYEMNDSNQEAKLIGKSNTWYETTIFKPKIPSYRKKPIKNNLKTIKVNKSSNLPKINKKEKNDLNKKEIKNENININTNANKTFLKKKRKRKKKIKYTKNSTVFELKRITDNPENQENKDNKDIQNNLENKDINNKKEEKK